MRGFNHQRLKLMEQDSQVTHETHDGYHWTKQDCPLCNKPPTRFVGKRGGASHRENLGVETDIWACAECNIVFPNPMPFPVRGLGQHYEVDADEYFQVYDKEDKLRSGVDLVMQAEKLLGRTGKLLEIGVGRGEVLIAAKDRGWKVFGIEPSNSFADYAESRTNAKIWRQTIEEADVPQHEFDAVIFSAVLEHVYNPDQVMAKVSGVLKSGGVLYVDVPNENGLYFRVGNIYQKLRGRDWCVNLAPTFSPFHVMGFSPKSFRAILNKHGLEPKLWKVYGGTGLVPSRGGIIGKFEAIAAKVVTAISDIGEMGTYMQTWAVKK